MYPQAGKCEDTKVREDGMFSVDVNYGCTDSVVLLARRYDLDQKWIALKTDKKWGYSQ